MPKHRRSSASSNEDAGPAHVSRSRYISRNNKGSIDRSIEKASIQKSPGQAADLPEKHVGALKLGEDVLNTDIDREAAGHRRLSTAMHPVADLSLDLGSRM